MVIAKTISRDLLADRQARKMDAAGAHLVVLADTLQRDAEETLDPDAYQAFLDELDE